MVRPNGQTTRVAHLFRESPTRRFLYRDILGVHFDPVSRTVEFKVPEIDLEWCEGHIPIGNEWIDAKWVKDGGGVRVSLSVPRRFKTKVSNS